MLDYVIRNGLVVDGTGAPGPPGRRRHPRRADRGRRHGRRPGRHEFDAEGLVVAPGIIDPHTHYDAQLFWDPDGLPVQPARRHHRHRRELRLHPGPDQGRRPRLHPADDGQGRGHAPRRPGERHRRGTGPASASTSPRLEGNLGVNAGFLVGHCAIRRWVMGADRAGEVADRRGARRHDRAPRRVDRGRRARASPRPSPAPTPTATATRSPPATPTAARCWPSARWCATTRGPRSSTSPTAASTPSADEEIDLMAAMTITARRPLNWNLLTVDARIARQIERQLVRLVDRGGGGRADRRPDHAHAGPHEHELPDPLRPLPHPRMGRRDGTPAEERMDKLARSRRSATQLDELAHEQGGRRVPRPLALGQLRHRRHLCPGERRATAGATWLDIAAEQGKAPFDTLLDLVSPTTCGPCCGPRPTTATTPRGHARADVWNDPGAMVGGSDAGAHLDRMCGSNYPTSFLGDCLRSAGWSRWSRPCT